MHLFNVKRLAGELRANSLSETEKYRYLLAIVVLQLLNAVARILVAPRTNHDLPRVLAASVVSLVGLHICHEINKRGDNQRFIERFLCLSVPISIWVYLSYLVSFYAGFIVTQTILGRAQANLIWASFSSVGIFISSAILVAHFGILSYFLGQIAYPQVATPSAPLAAPK